MSLTFEDKPRILLIDDDTGIQKVMRLFLENAGCEVNVRGSGDEALRMLAENDYIPDCVVLDIKMPGMPGTEILPRLKKLLPKTPVIMQTAISDIETGIESMRRGAFDYLIKPAMKDEIIETVKKALSYRKVLLDNERLEKENLSYQHSLEKMVQERTRQLNEALSLLQQTNLETVKVLAETIEAKDPYTRGHCNRVRLLSRELAGYLDMDEGQHEILEYGSLLHDIGKLGVPEKILLKESPFSPDEAKIIRTHPLIGENILKTVEFFGPCLKIIRHHHERYDGAGYPDGLSGSSINLAVRIVTLADSFDAMTSNRPYRKALGLDETIRELERQSGSQFDATLVELFIREKVYACVFAL